MGLATAAAGAFAAAIIGSVTKVTALEKELRPMVERSRIGAESLQILAEAAKRAGSARTGWKASPIPRRNCNSSSVRSPSWAAGALRKRWRRWGYRRRN